MESHRNLSRLALLALLPLWLGGCSASEDATQAERGRQVQKSIQEDQALDQYRTTFEKLDSENQQAFKKWLFNHTPLNRRRAELANSKFEVFSRYDYLSNGYDCPPEAPIKGNDPRDSLDGIYHKPGWVYYGATIPERCFRDQAQARKRGYRPSKIR